MRKILITVFAAGIGLAASSIAAGAGIFSETRMVIAILAGDLFLGDAVGDLSGAGTLAIHSQKKPELMCLGQFISSAESGGTGQMQCSDGATATFHFQRLSVFRGYGVGNFSRGAMSFVYGLTAEEAGPYLKLPEGRNLVQSGTLLELIDR